MANTLGAKAPPPLRATDGGFTMDSVVRRLPLIVQSVLDANDYDQDVAAALAKLRDEIAAGEPLAPLAKPSAEWRDALRPHLDARDTWLSAPWFLVENYLYKRILECTDAPTNGADPFAHQKSESLASSVDAFASMLEAKLTDAPVDVSALVFTSLWGNVADLSLSAGAKLADPAALASAGSAAKGISSRILADDSPALCDSLAAAKSVVIVLDNCGLELVSDLLLVDGLLRLPAAPTVHLHVKDRPVFVSDVVRGDVAPTLAWMEANGGADLAARLKSALSDGRLELLEHHFYTGPLAFWDMPEDLRARFSDACVVVLKGDANYRRLLGDRHWPHDTPFDQLMQLYWPQGVDVAALRTCKSGVLVGVDPTVEAAAAAAEPERWLTAGLYGLVSFASETSS